MEERDAPSSKSEEDESEARAREAFFAGRYREAFSLRHSAMLSKAVRWFSEEGVVFQRPPGVATPTDLIVALAFAASAEVRRRGEDAPYKLETAASLFAAIAELRMALDRAPPGGTDAMHEKLAELVIRSAMVGQVEMLMAGTELGWFDKLAQFEIDRERRRNGAAVINAKKADAKQQALNEAIRIAARNQTLSNEELARKVVEAAGLPTTIRTATEWVRQWRKQGYLPPVKPTGR